MTAMGLHIIIFLDYEVGSGESEVDEEFALRGFFETWATHAPQALTCGYVIDRMGPTKCLGTAVDMTFTNKGLFGLTPHNFLDRIIQRERDRPRPVDIEALDNFEHIVMAHTDMNSERQVFFALTLPIVIGGDFNIMRHPNEKKIELEMSGRQYTWANNLPNPTKSGRMKMIRRLNRWWLIITSYYKGLFGPSDATDVTLDEPICLLNVSFKIFTKYDGILGF
ncbi:hypothetical protein ACJX0J_031021 [Zea mays]